jgi:hypothetical protein
VVDAHEEGVEHDRQHDHILKELRLHDHEALVPKPVHWLHRNNPRVRVQKQTIDLHPFFLLRGKHVRSLPLLDLLIEFVNDNRYEKIENEEGCKEDENHIDGGNPLPVLLLRDLVNTYSVLS